MTGTGIIGEARQRIALGAQSARAAEHAAGAEIKSGVIATFAEMLAEPAVTGDVDTAVLHYMGEEALEDEAATEPYLNLAERIKAAPGDNVPVIIINESYDGPEMLPGQPSTRLMLIDKAEDTGGARFSSVREREEGVPMHAFTSSKAGVTHSTLSLVSPTNVSRGDLLKADGRLPRGEREEAFVLSTSHVADNRRGQGMPSDYAFSDYGTEALYGEPRIFVGWEEIEVACIESLLNAGNKEEAALKFGMFFNFTGLGGALAAIQENAPALFDIINGTRSLRGAIAGAAMRGE